MLHVESNNYTVKFTFRHIKPKDNLIEINNRLIHAVTQCNLTVNNESFTGIAACVLGDSFNKETGRKIALTRALQKAGLPKDVRADVWIAYFNRGNENVSNPPPSSPTSEGREINLPNLSDANDKWNKMALGVSGNDVPRPQELTSEGIEIKEAHEALDDIGAPREDGMGKFSLSGRAWGLSNRWAEEQESAERENTELRASLAEAQKEIEQLKEDHNWALETFVAMGLHGTAATLALKLKSDEV